MAAVSMSWDTNTAAVTSCENALQLAVWTVNRSSACLTVWFS